MKENIITTYVVITNQESVGKDVIVDKNEREATTPPF
jgi:hypothetical protein